MRRNTAPKMWYYYCWYYTLTKTFKIPFIYDLLFRNSGLQTFVSELSIRYVRFINVNVHARVHADEHCHRTSDILLLLILKPTAKHLKYISFTICGCIPPSFELSIPNFRFGNAVSELSNPNFRFGTAVSELPFHNSTDKHCNSYTTIHNTTHTRTHHTHTHAHPHTHTHLSSTRLDPPGAALQGCRSSGGCGEIRVRAEV